MTIPQDRLAAAITFFFDRALPGVAGKRYSQLASPLVHVGEYVRSSGAPVTTPGGQSVTPVYTLRVSPQVPMTSDGRPTLDGVAIGAAAPTVSLLWLRHLADALVDSEVEIRRVMADLDTFEHLFDAPAPAAAGASAAPGPGTGAAAATSAGRRADQWAHAIATLPAAQRATLRGPLTALTSVPAGLATVAPDLGTLRQTLHHFFTYRDDGTYYAKWAGAPGDMASSPQLHADYRQLNALEVKLNRDAIYLYAVVPEQLLTGAGDTTTGIFREVVIRFDENASTDMPYRLRTVHTARWVRAAAPHEDFVFFYADEGEGLAIPPPALAKMSARLRTFLVDLAEAGDRVQDFYVAAREVTIEPTPLVHMLATVTNEATALTFPEGVLASGEGAVRTITVPPAKIADVAAMPAVLALTTVSPCAPLLDRARAMVSYPGLETRLPAGHRHGKGVLVGVIDTGVDGRHPAFAGRLVAFWNQDNAPPPGNQNPRARHPGVAAYTNFHWGTEVEDLPNAAGVLTTTNTLAAIDPSGHGTHVTGIAAGAQVVNAAGAVQEPAGLAPEAFIVVVRSIEATAGNYLRAVEYIFQKANELGAILGTFVPCVINMSFGNSSTGHDGSSAESQRIFSLVRNVGSTAYLPGRILVGAAGNERGWQTHVKRTATAGNMVAFPVQTGAWVAPPPAAGPPLRSEAITLWVKNPNAPTAAPPAVFPLDLWIYRQSNPSANTRVVRLGAAGTTTSFPGLGVNVSISSQLFDTNTRDFNFTITFTSIANQYLPNDTWMVALINGHTQDLEIHAWLQAGSHGFSAFPGPFQPGDNAFLINVPSDSPGVISVASCNSNAAPNGDISGFSSPGPLRTASRPLTGSGGIYNTTEDFNAVDVTAPGNRIQSARATPPTNIVYPAADIITPISALLQGTSMASPVVAGIVANLLSVKPNLTTTDVKDRLKRASAIPAAASVQPPPGPPGRHPYTEDWGFGLIDCSLLDIT